MTSPDQDPRTRLRDAREAIYRHAILDAAEQVFAEQGYDAAKVQDVAVRAGVSLATLYKLFPGKADMRRAVHDLRIREILAASTSDLPQGDPLDLLLTGTVAYVRFQLAHPHYLQITLREAATWSSRASMTLPEQIDAWDQGYALAVEVFRAGIALGAFVDDAPELHARLMISILQIILGDWVEGGMATPVDEVVRRTSDALVRACATDATRARWFERRPPVHPHRDASSSTGSP